jgi:hypothetical protein
MPVVYNFIHGSICEMSYNLFILEPVREGKCVCGGGRMMSWNVAI